ncbi:MAG: polyprenol monophosphomannose synthase [Anaerolineaceae bacterium]|nr:polyprenol monophosphomannose synthase [Anaerolineaceae bacterium]
MSTIIVIPTYNERENLPTLVDKLFSLPISDLKLLIVDDNSPDGTGQMADDYAVQKPGKVHTLHRSGKLGLGTAYVAGFKKALELGADRIVQMDADFSHPPEKLVEMLEASHKCDLVLGSRYIPGGSLDKDWPWYRKALSGFGNFYARTILGVKVRDITGGFRMWNRNALERIPLDRIRSNGYMFQVEMAYLASKLGFSVIEVPIYFAERKFGKSKINLSIQVEAAISVWKLPFRYADIRRVK